jgi:multidrug efflux pump
VLLCRDAKRLEDALCTAPHGRLYDVSERVFERIYAAYRRLLATALAVRPPVILFGVSVGAASGVLATRIPSELAAIEDRGTIIGIISGPEGAAMAYITVRATHRNYACRGPGDRGLFHGGGVRVRPPEPGQFGDGLREPQTLGGAHRKQQEIAADSCPSSSPCPGYGLPHQPGAARPELSPNVHPVLIQAGSFQELQGWVAKLMEKASAFPGIVNLDSDLKLNKPELRVTVDRDKAADMGVELADIGTTLETLLGGRQVTASSAPGTNTTSWSRSRRRSAACRRTWVRSMCADGTAGSRSSTTW